MDKSLPPTPSNQLSPEQQKILAEYKVKADKIINEMIHVLASANAKVDQAEYQKWLTRIKSTNKYG